jgi:hypothetical protein
MNLDLVIEQLRTNCPLLGGRVGGAADFKTGLESVLQFQDPVTGTLLYPSAAVIPLFDEASDTDNQPGPQLVETVNEHIGVIVEFNATSDRRGQGGVDQVEEMKYALHSALLNWNPTPFRAVKGLRTSGGRLLEFDRARLWWQFEYYLECMVTDGDGFPISGDPLTDALGTFTGPPGGPPPYVTMISFDALAVSTVTGVGSLSTDIQNNTTLTISSVPAIAVMPPGTLVFGDNVLAGLSTLSLCSTSGGTTLCQVPQGLVQLPVASQPLTFLLPL